jgi:hypothetical protein
MLEQRGMQTAGNTYIKPTQEYDMATQSAEIIPFNNGSDLEFADISSELWREYRFVGGEAVRIHGPLKLNVSASGGHRVFDDSGVSHYIPAGWIHLMWQTKDGAPNFVK